MEIATRKLYIFLHRFALNLIYALALLFFLFAATHAQAVAAQVPITSNQSLQQEIAKANVQLAQLSGALTQLKDENAKMRLEQNTLTQQEVAKIREKLDAAGFSTTGITVSIIGIVLTLTIALAAFAKFDLRRQYETSLSDLRRQFDMSVSDLKNQFTVYENQLREVSQRSVEASKAHLDEQSKLHKNQFEGLVKEHTKNMIDVSRSQVQTSSFGRISMAFWQEYGRLKVVYKPDATTEGEKSRNLNTAISLGRIAIERTESLNHTEYDELIVSVKSNCAYFLLERYRNNTEQSGRNETEGLAKADKTEALVLAEQCYGIAIKYKNMVVTDFKWRECLESCCWVLCLLSEEQDKRAAVSLIQEFCRNDKLDPVWRARIHIKYKNYLNDAT